MRFKEEWGDWTEYRKLPNAIIIDDYHPPSGRQRIEDHVPYWERMARVYGGALRILKIAQKEGRKFVVFVHGWSTSGRGRTTTRSQIRSLMRSPDATPYIIRKECIQHYSVFVAAIRPLPANSADLAETESSTPDQENPSSEANTESTKG